MKLGPDTPVLRPLMRLLLTLRYNPIGFRWIIKHADKATIDLVCNVCTKLVHYSPRGNSFCAVDSGPDKAQAAPAAAAAAAGGGGGNAGLSAEEMQAAMRSVEDETDAAAAAALEQENAAELAEFTMEPAARVSLHADRDGAEGRQKGGGGGSGHHVSSGCILFCVLYMPLFPGILAHHLDALAWLDSCGAGPDCLLKSQGQGGPELLCSMHSLHSLPNVRSLEVLKSLNLCHDHFKFCVNDHLAARICFLLFNNMAV